MALLYVPYMNDFVKYEAAPLPKVELTLPLMDNPVDISDWASEILPSGMPIVKDSLPTATRSKGTYVMSDSINTEDLSKLSFEDLIKLENLPVKITSGYRNRKNTKSGHHSYHNLTDSLGNSKAYDIVPTNGDFEQLLNTIYSNPRIVNWLKLKGYGVLEEISPEIMRKTGATGKHLHIGPDPAALKMFNNRISKAQEGMKIAPFVEYLATEIPEARIEIPVISNPADTLFDLYRGYKPVTTEQNDGLPTATRSLSTYVMPEPSKQLEEIPQTLSDGKRHISDRTKGALKELLIQTINKLSKTNPNVGKIRQFLLDTAAFESSYRLNSSSTASSASGWFGFLDSTKRMALQALGINATRQQFNTNPELLVLAATWLYNYHMNLANKNGSLAAARNKGYSDNDVIHSYWLNPTWAKNYFLHGKEGGKDAFGTNVPKYLKKIHS